MIRLFILGLIFLGLSLLALNPRHGYPPEISSVDAQRIPILKAQDFPTPKQIETLASIEVPEPVSAGVGTNCGDNWYANFIYMHESGCNTYNPNPSSGACGLGQAWPCSKLTAACPNMDYACENAFFTAYANNMGGWEAAYNVWVSKGWW